MGLLSSLALVLLALVGYTSGLVVTIRGRRVEVSLVDLIAIATLWVIALATQGALRIAESTLANRWIAVAVWLIIGFGLGALLGGLRSRQYAPEKTAAIPDPVRGLRRWWERWKGFATRIGNVQSRVWLGFFYFAVVLPFGLGARLLGDPLGTRKRSPGSSWVAKQQPGSDLDSVRSQF